MCGNAESPIAVMSFYYTGPYCSVTPSWMWSYHRSFGRGKEEDVEVSAAELRNVHLNLLSPPSFYQKIKQNELATHRCRLERAFGDICIIDMSETRLNQSVSDAEVILDNFTLIRSDRTEQSEERYKECKSRLQDEDRESPLK